MEWLELGTREQEVMTVDLRRIDSLKKSWVWLAGQFVFDNHLTCDANARLKMSQQYSGILAFGLLLCLPWTDIF